MGRIMKTTLIDETYYYSFSLRFFHPSINPAEITKTLNIEPDYAWKVGSKRRTPDGTILEGKHTQSYWCANHETTGQRNFFKEIEKMLNYLTKNHRPFFDKIAKESGRVEIYLQLHGRNNIGSSLKPKIMKLMVALNIELGVEVFPRMRKAAVATK